MNWRGEPKRGRNDADKAIANPIKPSMSPNSGFRMPKSGRLRHHPIGKEACVGLDQARQEGGSATRLSWRTSHLPRAKTFWGKQRPDDQNTQASYTFRDFRARQVPSSRHGRYETANESFHSGYSPFSLNSRRPPHQARNRVRPQTSIEAGRKLQSSDDEPMVHTTWPTDVSHESLFRKHTIVVVSAAQNM